MLFQVLWEAELQKELEYQRHAMTARDTKQQPTAAAHVYPDG